MRMLYAVKGPSLRPHEARSVHPQSVLNRYLVEKERYRNDEREADRS